MALCAVAAWDTLRGQYLLTAVDPQPVDMKNCAGGVLLSSSDFTNFQAAATAFGFDLDLFGIAFGGGVVIFAVGLGIGLVVSQVRKLKM